jgi:hopanoid-associated phosphorylase
MGHVTLLVATGLRREARLIAGRGVVVIAGGGDAVRLEHELEMLAGSATALLSSGLAGALAPDLAIGDIVISGGCVGVDAPVSAFASQLARWLPEARLGLVAAGDVPVASADEKRLLYARTEALAVDMESHVAARVAARHGLPFAALRVISDAADDGLPPAALAGMQPDGRVAIGPVIAALARDPRQLPLLVRTARHANKAFRALGGLHDMLRGRGIGRLDPRQLALDMA